MDENEKAQADWKTESNRLHEQIRDEFVKLAKRGIIPTAEQVDQGFAVDWG